MVGRVSYYPFIFHVSQVHRARRFAKSLTDHSSGIDNEDDWGVMSVGLFDD